MVHGSAWVVPWTPESQSIIFWFVCTVVNCEWRCSKFQFQINVIKSLGGIRPGAGRWVGDLGSDKVSPLSPDMLTCGYCRQSIVTAPLWCWEGSRGAPCVVNMRIMWIRVLIMPCRGPAVAVSVFPASTSPSSPRAQLTGCHRPPPPSLPGPGHLHHHTWRHHTSYPANHTAKHHVFHKLSLPNLQLMPHSIQDPSVRAKRGARK